MQLLNIFPGGPSLRGLSPAMKEEELRATADRLVREGRHGEAIPIYRRLAHEFPHEGSHLLALGWALYDSGRSEEAAGCFEDLFAGELKKGVFTGFAYDELVRLYRREGNWPALISVCERAVAARPGDPALLMTLGEAYLAAGRPRQASAAFEELVALDAEAAPAWCALGDARLLAGDEKGAVAAYEQAANLDRQAAPAFYSRLAAAFLGQGNPQGAREAMERSLELRPDDPLSAARLGEILVHLGEIEAAFGAFAKAQTIRPEACAALWHRLGRLLEEKGMDTKAAAAYQRGLEAEPRNSRCALALAAAYLRAGKPSLAAAVLKEIKDLP